MWPELQLTHMLQSRTPKLIAETVTVHKIIVKEVLLRM